jgi:hypothetical protein
MRLRADPHMLYRVGSDRLLHVYVTPDARLREAISAREAIQSRGGEPSGYPRMLAVAETADAIWVLEDRVDGTPVDRLRRDRWWDGAVEWAVAFGRPIGPPLAETPWWRAARERLPGAVPGEHAAVAAALDALAGLRSAPVHGDYQPKNLLLHAGDIGVIDWETAVDGCLPGLDLVFLAVMARDVRPEAAVLHELAAAREPSPGPLLAALRAVGIDGSLLPALLVAAAAKWADDERQRLRRPGVPPIPPLYAPLLTELITGARR